MCVVLFGASPKQTLSSALPALEKSSRQQSSRSRGRNHQPAGRVRHPFRKEPFANRSILSECSSVGVEWPGLAASCPCATCLSTKNSIFSFSSSWLCCNYWELLGC